MNQVLSKRILGKELERIGRSGSRNMIPFLKYHKSDENVFIVILEYPSLQHKTEYIKPRSLDNSCL